MNNISQITKAKRLTEEEVHQVAEELSKSGVKASSIEVYKFLGRGSLTTITNYLKTWNQDETKNTLPALITLPETLKAATEQILVKIWIECQDEAEKQIKSQQEGLRLAEENALNKIAEAEAFSEEQAKIIESWENQNLLLQEKVEERQKYFNAEKEELNKKLTQERKEKIIFEQKLLANEEKIKKLEKELENEKILHSLVAQDNKTLREKAARLEGELHAWQILKPKKKDAPVKATPSGSKPATKEFKQADTFNSTENKETKQELKP